MQYSEFLIRYASQLLLALAFCTTTLFTPTTNFGAITPTGDVWPGYTSTDPWIVNYLDVGASDLGVGALTIDNGSEVHSQNSRLGNETGSSGTATIDGVGSVLRVDKYMDVGDTGLGTLNIVNGGSVEVTRDTCVGCWDPEAGTVNFSQGTLNTRGLTTAASRLLGTGTVNAKGLVSDMDLVFDSSHGLQQQFHLNSLPGQDVTLNLDYSDPESGAPIGVGYGGNATLTITDGMAVSAYNGNLGYTRDSEGTATVTGAGSTWNANGTLFVGRYGNGTLNVQDAGTVNSEYTNIGTYSDSIGSATVTGTGSIWNAGSLDVGEYSQGTLRIENGGTLNTRGASIGAERNSTGSVTVTGTGSTWSGGYSIQVGNYGFGTLTIENGAVVNNEEGTIGGDTIDPSVVTVTGAGSTWNNSSYLFVGNEGPAELIISNGGIVNAARETRVGGSVIRFDNGTLNTGNLWAASDDLLGNGTIYVTGMVADTDLVIDASTGLHTQVVLDSLPGQNVTINLDLNGPGHTRELGAGYSDAGTLTIADGMVVETSRGYLGYGSQSSGTATVSGAGSAWNNSSALQVGLYGTGILNIEQGATVHSSSGLVGYSGIGSATISGSGSEWYMEDDLSIGTSRSGASTLVIRDGGLVRNANANLGRNGNSTLPNATVIVSGPGSVWDSTGTVTVGKDDLGKLTIENGGVVNSGMAKIGSSNRGTGSVIVDGPGSAWHVSGNLDIGSVERSTIIIRNGATVTSGNGDVSGNYHWAADAVVTGAGSQWISDKTLTVNTSGLLNIENGGLVHSKAGRVVTHVTTGTAEANISGAGAVWMVDGELSIGRAGTSTINILDGGTVSVGGDMIVGTYQGTGIVNLDGGLLDLNGTNLDRQAGTAIFNFSSGTLKDAAIISLDQPFVQLGGTLAPGGSIGQTHITGDYELAGGTVEIEVGGVVNPHDLMTATGHIDIATLGTTLNLLPIGPMEAGTYTLIESLGGTINGMFENIMWHGIGPVLYDVQYSTNTVTLTLHQDLVPESGTVGLLMIGILWGTGRRSVRRGA